MKIFLHILVSLSKKCLSTQTCTLYAVPCVVKSSSVEAVVAVYVHPNHRNYTRCAPNLSRVECLYLVVPTPLLVRTHTCMSQFAQWIRKDGNFFRREGSTSAKKKYEHYHSYWFLSSLKKGWNMKRLVFANKLDAEWNRYMPSCVEHATQIEIDKVANCDHFSSVR